MSPLVQPPASGAGPTQNHLRPAGALYETFRRQGASIANSVVLATTRVTMVAIELPSGLLVTSISFVSATTAASVPLNQLFGLYDDPAGTTSGTPYALLRGSVDDTTTAWGASTAKTLALTSTYTTLRSGFFYLGILVVATTVPSLAVGTGLAGVTGIAPVLGGPSTSGVTALPNPAAAPTAAATMPYAWVS